MKNLAIIVILLGTIAYGIFNYHFILLDKNIKILKKETLTIEYSFVDARGAKKAKLFLIPALLKAGIKDIFQQTGEQ